MRADYERYRREHEQRLDDDYRAWRHSRMVPAPEPSRDAGEPRDEGPLESLGRAISETVTAAAEDDGPPDRPRR